MAETLMGLETEYAFTPVDKAGHTLDRTRYAALLVSLARERHDSLRGCNPGDLYLANGSRLYVDAALGLVNLEYSTPECSSPAELVSHVRAGDRLVAELAQALRDSQPELVEVFVSKTNVDYSGHTSGSHENYLHQAPQATLARQLVPHLVSRIVYSGGGGFDEQYPGLRFLLSPRVGFLEEIVSDGSQSHRGIFTTRMEPLSRSRHGRLHLLCGEGVRFATSEYLRFGATALVVCMVDAGKTPGDAVEINPMQAIEAVTSDLGCRTRVGRIDGREVSALDIQRHYLRQAEACLGASFMPAWSEALCRCWAETLDALETDPGQLAGVLDWPTKLLLYRSFADDWHACKRQLTFEFGGPPELRDTLFECDIRYGDIAADNLHSRVEADASVLEFAGETAVGDAMQRPPTASRARLRGHWIGKLGKAEPSPRCNWDGILDVGRRRRLRFDDPFGREPVSWNYRPSMF